MCWLRAHDVVMTSNLRRCDVIMTSHRRQFDFIPTTLIIALFTGTLLKRYTSISHGDEKSEIGEGKRQVNENRYRQQ